MQREVATTDGWMVAMLRIYCEFIAMLHHPVGPVARAGDWLSIYYSIMQQQWNERSRGWVFVLGAPAAGVKSHLITWSLSWSCFYCRVWRKQQTGCMGSKRTTKVNLWMSFPWGMVPCDILLDDGRRISWFFEPRAAWIEVLKLNNWVTTAHSAYANEEGSVLISVWLAL